MPQTLITVKFTPEEYADLTAAVVTAMNAHSQNATSRIYTSAERYDERLKAERLAKLRQGL